MEIKNNTTLWVYYNFKETADVLSKKGQKDFWWLVINYAFGEEKLVENELIRVKKDTKIAFLSIKNLLKLRKSGGSQNGKSNNPNGLAKGEQPNIAPNITPNITPIPLIKEENIKEKEYKYKGTIIKLNDKDYKDWKAKYNLLDLDFELGQIDLLLQTEKYKNKRKDWFFMVQGWLNKTQKEKENKNPKQQTLDEWKKSVGMNPIPTKLLDGEV